MTQDVLRPTPLAARALGPDLARGFMLAFIALANSHYFLSGRPVLGGYPQGGSRLDSVVTWVVSTFVDGRAFPMFGLLFGYGVAQIVRRQEPRGPRAVRRVLWRRAIVLVVLGFLHATLLFAGDILGAYGVLLLVGAWMVRWRDGWLLVVALVFLALNAMPSPDLFVLSPVGPDASMLPPDPLTAVVERAQVSAFVSAFGPLGFLCPFAVGLWAGRRRLLEQPELHRRLLGVVAVVGVGAAVLGAQPAALVLAGVRSLPDPVLAQRFEALHDATGTLGGFGYAALIVLVAARLGSRRRRWVDAVAAVGQRSMTCYLSQSVVWAVVFTPFLLDLSGTLDVTSTALLAIATWLATVAMADWMRRTGRRGPFEVLVRRVTYGRPSTRRSW